MSAATKVGHSPDLCNIITSYVEAPTLQPLSLVSKTFQQFAQARLFQSLYFDDLAEAGAVCKAVGDSAHLVSHLRAIYVLQDTRRVRHSSLDYDHWRSIAQLLKRASNLLTILLVDQTLSNTWIFNELGKPPFQARVVKVKFEWDGNLVEFLGTQNELRFLETSCPDPCQLALAESEGSTQILLPKIPVGTGIQFLPRLERLETQLSIVQQILAPFPGRTHYPPLTHIQINHLGDAEKMILSFLPNLRWVSKTLRSLYVEVPEALAWKSMTLIAQAAPNLRYIGLIHLPDVQLHQLISTLLHLPKLHSLDVDVSSWIPQPAQPAQRSLASLFRTFAPNLRHVGFWINRRRWIWEVIMPVADRETSGMEWEVRPGGLGKWHGVLDNRDSNVHELV